MAQRVYGPGVRCVGWREATSASPSYCLKETPMLYRVRAQGALLCALRRRRGGLDRAQRAEASCADGPFVHPALALVGAGLRLL